MSESLGFHWKDGWYFKRLDDGSVRIRHPQPQFSTQVHAWNEVTIPAAEWASIIASVSAKGETAESYPAAYAFHASQQLHVLGATPEPAEPREETKNG